MRRAQEISQNERAGDCILETKNIFVQFGGLMAVNDVDFALPHGQIRAIIGPNGAGKTTFFNLITGLHKVKSGQIFFKGRDITNLPPYKRVKLGIGRSFQVVNLFSDLSVEKNVQIAVQASLKEKNGPFERVDRGEISRRTEQLLATYEWIPDPTLLAGALIYPEQKKLETLMALALEPELILLDEPSAGVDENDIWLITEMIRTVSRHCTVLLTDHDIKFVLNMADRITVFDHGCVLAEGTPAEIVNDQRVNEIYYGGSG